MLLKFYYILSVVPKGVYNINVGGLAFYKRLDDAYSSLVDSLGDLRSFLTLKIYDHLR